MIIDNNTKVYIAGCGGMLGEAVYQAFSQRATVKATDIDLNAPWLEYADVRSYQEMRQSVLEFGPDLIINLAALTDMEECEVEADNAWLTNALGAENLALLANELDVPLIYISTAGIFGGEKETFNDFDTPNPLSVYAKSKYAGELFVREHVRRYHVVRAGWMMGGGPAKDKKFVNKIYKQIKAGAKVLRVVDDKLGTPTYTRDFAAGLLALAESGLYGVYNQACGGAGSRYEVAQEFVRLLGLRKKVSVVKVGSDFFKAEYFSPRPASEILVDMKLDARGLNRMRDWRTALAEYAEEFAEDLRRAPAPESAPAPAAAPPVALRIVTEAATPHNNYLFGRIAASGEAAVEMDYIYRPTSVPGRPWKSLPDQLPHVRRVRSGLGGWFDAELLLSALRGGGTIHFIIGWNHPLLLLALTLIGLRRAPLLTWFDTPAPSPHPAWHPKNLLKAWAVRMINRSPGTVFVTGQLAAKGVAALGIDPAKTRTLPFFTPDPFDGLPPGAAGEFRARHGIDGEAVVLLAAGRMIRSKGFDLLIEALAACQGRLEQAWTLVLVGSGPEQEALERQAAAAGLQASVKFLPWLEADEFAHLMSVADVFVAPARFDPFPTTIVSAMNAGLAVVATEGVGSAHELVAPGDSGLIVPNDSPQALGEALAAAINSKELRERLGENAIEAIARWPVEQGVFEVLEAARRAARGE